MENKKNGALEIILFIVSVLLIFVFNSFFGVIFAIISLIISISKLKNKHVLTIISFLGSSVLIIYSVIAFVLSFNVINDILDNAKENSDKENQIEANTNCLHDLCYELYDGYFVDEKIMIL